MGYSSNNRDDGHIEEATEDDIFKKVYNLMIKFPTVVQFENVTEDKHIWARGKYFLDKSLKDIKPAEKDFNKNNLLWLVVTNPSTRQDKYGQTFLHKAIMDKEEQLIETLMSACPALAAIEDAAGNIPDDDLLHQFEQMLELEGEDEVMQ